MVDKNKTLLEGQGRRITRSTIYGRGSVTRGTSSAPDRWDMSCSSQFTSTDGAVCIFVRLLRTGNWSESTGSTPSVEVPPHPPPHSTQQGILLHLRQTLAVTRRYPTSCFRHRRTENLLRVGETVTLDGETYDTARHLLPQHPQSCEWYCTSSTIRICIFRIRC